MSTSDLLKITGTELCKSIYSVIIPAIQGRICLVRTAR